jgi:hypothetical protein
MGSSFQLETIPVLAVTRIGALALKWNAFRNDDYSLSLLFREYYFFKEKLDSRDLVAYLDTYTNSRFVSYLKLTFAARRPSRMPFSTSDDFDRATSEIQSTQGILLNNWDKIIFGTKYNFVEKNIGGHLGYMFIGDNLHTLIGLESSNFRKLRYGKNGYALYMDIFARW